MALDVTLDIAEMLADFGVSVTKDAATFTGILVDEYEAQTVYGIDVDSSAPILTTRTADTSTYGRGDTFVIGGVSYLVHSVQDDGTGVTVFVLGKD